MINYNETVASQSIIIHRADTVVDYTYYHFCKYDDEDDDDDDDD